MLHNELEHGAFKNDSLGKANKVFVVGIHISQLAVDEHQYLVFASLFLLTDKGCDDSLRLLAKPWITVHLQVEDGERSETVNQVAFLAGK